MQQTPAWWSKRSAVFFSQMKAASPATVSRQSGEPGPTQLVLPGFRHGAFFTAE